MANNYRVPNSYNYGWMNFESTYEKDVFAFMMYSLSKMEIKDQYNLEDHIIEFDANEMLPLTGKGNQPNKYKDAVENLMDAKLRFIEPKTKDSIITRVISSARFIKGTTTIRLEIPQAALPMLVAGANNYTVIDLEILMALRKSSAKRLYELLSQFKSTGRAEFGLDDFRGKMGTLDLKTGKIIKYPDWKDFKKRCILDSVEEINRKYTDLNVRAEFIRRGRKIVSVVFDFNSKSYQTTINFEKLLSHSPESETSSYYSKLKRLGVSDWQIDFVVKYRRSEIDKWLDVMKLKNYDQFMKNPHTMGAFFSVLAGCKNKAEINEWKASKGLV